MLVKEEEKPLESAEDKDKDKTAEELEQEKPEEKSEVHPEKPLLDTSELESKLKQYK